MKDDRHSAVSIAKSQRAEHHQPLFADRVVDEPALVVEHHRRPIGRVEGRPARQLRRVRIAGPRERDPRVADLVGERHRLGSAAGETRRRLDVVERERNLDRVRRLQTAAVDRRLPAEVVEVDRAFAERRAPLGDLHHRPAVAVVARDQEVEVGRRRAGIRLLIHAESRRRRASPSNCRMRVRIAGVVSEKSAACALDVSSVRVEPSISGTSAETRDAVGWNGCCGTTLPSTIGEKPCVI